MNDLGKRAADIGLSAKQVAEQCGLSAQTVRSVFSDTGNPLTSSVRAVEAAVSRIERERLAQLSRRVLAHEQAAA